jgi:hypothetical protein
MSGAWKRSLLEGVRWMEGLGSLLRKTTPTPCSVLKL